MTGAGREATGHDKKAESATTLRAPPLATLGSRVFLVLPGEGLTLAYLGTVFLVFGLGLAVGRSASDALFFKRFGVEYLPWMFVATGVCLAVASAAYAEWVDRLPAERMLGSLVLAIGGVVALAWAAMFMLGGRWTYALYFLVYGVASELALIHINHYASGFFDVSSEKRLYPLVVAASRVGAVIGGATVGVLGNSVPVVHFALLWIATLGVALVLVALRHRVFLGQGERRPNRPQPALEKIAEGLRYARRSRLLQLSGIGAFLLIAAISIQDFVASTLITRHFPDEGSLTAFFGWFIALTNAGVLLIQLFFTGRFIRRYGLSSGNLVFPWTTLTTFTFLAFLPSFVAAVAARVNYTGVPPAFRNPVANLFFNAFPAHVQGRARALITGVVMPLGLFFAGLILILLPRDDLAPAIFVGLALTAAILFFKTRKNRVYEETLLKLVNEMVFVRDCEGIEDFGRLSDDIAKRLVERLSHADPDEAKIIVEILGRGAPDIAFALVSVRCAALDPALRDTLLRHLATIGFPHWQTIARENLADGDLHLRATALKLLVADGDAEARRTAVTWLDSLSPRLKGEAAGTLVAHADGEDRRRGRATLATMLESGDHSARLSALFCAIDGGDPSLLPGVRAHLRYADPRGRVAALRAFCMLSARAGQDCGGAAAVGLDDPSEVVRIAAVQGATHIADDQDRTRILARALADESFAVRRAAQKSAGALAPRTAEGWRHVFTAHGSDFDTLETLVPALGASPLDERDTLLAELSGKHLDRAHELCGARIDLSATAGPHPSREVGFLGRALDEEVGRNLAVVLLALEALDERRAVAIVRGGLASRDRKVRARALESARTLRDDALMRPLVEILEEEFAPTPTPRTATRTMAQVVATAQRYGGLWLGQCAAACLTVRSEGG